MILDEPYNSWLLKNVGENLNENVRFQVKVTATTSNGPVELELNLDLIWFLLLNSDDTEKMKLDVALALLQKKGYLEQFKATLTMHDAKRLIIEFLLFNDTILLGIAKYIDFTLLNVPLDFISHALLIKLEPDAIDSGSMTRKRIAIVDAVLKTGYKLPKDVPPKSEGVAIKKVLDMDIGPQKYKLVTKLLQAGFHLFGDNSSNNNDVACSLIEGRDDKDADKIIRNNKDVFLELKFKIAGTSGSNIADYYYWVKEDIKAVEYIRKVLNIDITS